MEVVQGVERLWKDLAHKLFVRAKMIREMKTLHHSHDDMMDELIKEYIRYTPNHSWENVARALQRMGLHQQADTVTTKYIQGILATILCPLLHRNVE